MKALAETFTSMCFFLVHISILIHIVNELLRIHTYIYINTYVKTKIVQCASKNIDKTQKKALTRTTRFILQLVSSVQAESSG